jgi:hypothetical protein
MKRTIGEMCSWSILLAAGLYLGNREANLPEITGRHAQINGCAVKTLVA